MQFEGIYTPVITPYFEDFSLNHEGLAKTIDHLINAGVHGLIVAGVVLEPHRMPDQLESSNPQP